MNGDDLISGALAVHTTSFTLSLAAIYAIFGDKFVRPLIERADALCARLRGDLTTELASALKPFTPSDTPPVVANFVLDADGKPLNSALIANASTLNSEAFREAVSDFLESESPDFNRYWQAFCLRVTIKNHWNAVRSSAGIWPISGIVAVAIFWGISKQLIPMPPNSWICAVAAVFLLPPVLFMIRIPLLAFAANRLENLEG